MVRRVAHSILTSPIIRLAVSSLTFILTIFVTPAKAQTSGEVGITGYVAPRCWVSMGGTHSGISAEPKALCNYGTPETRTRRLTPQTEAMIAANIPATDPEELSARAAREIVVSPRL